MMKLKLIIVLSFGISSLFGMDTELKSLIEKSDLYQFKKTLHRTNLDLKSVKTLKNLATTIRESLAEEHCDWVLNKDKSDINKLKIIIATTVMISTVISLPILGVKQGSVNFLTILAIMMIPYAYIMYNGAVGLARMEDHRRHLCDTLTASSKIELFLENHCDSIKKPSPAD